MEQSLFEVAITVDHFLREHHAASPEDLCSSFGLSRADCAATLAWLADRGRIELGMSGGQGKVVWATNTRDAGSQRGRTTTSRTIYHGLAASYPLHNS